MDDDFGCAILVIFVFFMLFVALVVFVVKVDHIALQTSCMFKLSLPVTSRTGEPINLGSDAWRVALYNNDGKKIGSLFYGKTQGACDVDLVKDGSN